MKKATIALMALTTIFSAAIAVSAEETLSGTLIDTANKINQVEQTLTNLQTSSETRQKAREEALNKKKQEWEAQKEQAKKDFQEKYGIQSQIDTNIQEYQKKKEAWNTLLGK